MTHDSQDPSNGKTLIGSLATFLRTAAKISPAQPDSHTPCNGCDTCCHSVFTRISLTPEEQVRFGVEFFDMTEKGRCPYMGDTGCEIYAQRPQTCRMFDCRQLTACEVVREEIGGIPPLPNPQLNALAQKWAFKPLSAEDRLAAKAWVEAINWAAASLQKDGATVEVMAVIGRALKKHHELVKAGKK